MTETRAIIDDRVNRLGWRFKDAATITGVSVPTLRKKCADPKLFTGLELRHLIEGLKLSDAQQETILAEVFTRR